MTEAGRAPLLQARQVRLARPDRSGGRQAVLDDISLDLAAGELVVVVGPSGGGKSTLLRLFNRLLEPDAGQILYAGRDVRELAPPELRAEVALVAQKPLLFAGTVRDNLSASARLRRQPPPRDADLDALLELCRIEGDWLGRDGRRLSVGQQQRVCLARALAGPSRALLLDEPTSALDWPTAEALARTFRDLADRRHLAVLLVTHDLRIARHCADRLVVLIEGRIAADGPFDEVLADPGSASAERFLQHPETAPERTAS